MKYVIFLAFVCTAVPAMTLLATTSKRCRSVLLALLVMSPMLGARGSINFWSMEDYRGPDRGFEVSLTDLVAASLAASLILGRAGRLVWIPYNALPLALYFGCSAASLVSTPDPVISSFTVFKLLRCGLVYWVVVNSVRSRTDLRAMLSGWMLAGLVMMLLAGVQKYALGVWRVFGPFDHSNTIPLYLNLVLAPVLMWGLVDDRLSRPMRALTLLSVVGMAFSVVSTFSRAGIALCALSFLATLAVALWRVPTPRTFLIGSVAALLITAGSIKAAPRVLARFEHAAPESMEAREEFLAAAWRMAADSPNGVGINAFSEVMSTNRRYREDVRVMATESSSGVVHNIYMLTLAELGHGGLAVFLLSILRFVWIGLRASLGPASMERRLAAAATIGMVTVHLSGFLEWAFRITPVTYQYVLVAGFVVALLRLSSPSRMPAPVMSRARGPSPRPSR